MTDNRARLVGPDRIGPQHNEVAYELIYWDHDNTYTLRAYYPSSQRRDCVLRLTGEGAKRHMLMSPTPIPTDAQGRIALVGEDAPEPRGEWKRGWISGDMGGYFRATYPTNETGWTPIEYRVAGEGKGKAKDEGVVRWMWLHPDRKLSSRTFSSREACQSACDDLEAMFGGFPDCGLPVRVRLTVEPAEGEDK